FGATAVFAELRTSLNRIWGCHPKEGAAWREMLWDRLVGFGMVLATGFGLMLSVLAAAAVEAALSYVDWIPISRHLVRVADSGISLALATALFSLIYRFVPDERLPWRNVVMGATTTAVLF